MLASAVCSSLWSPDVAPVVRGCFGQICTAHAQQLVFPSF